MRRTLVFVSVYLLSAGVSLAQSPADLLARAVEKSRLCGFVAEKTQVDERGKALKWTAIKPEDSRSISRLTLQKLFKPGRFLLDERVVRDTVNGRPSLIIRFDPQPERQQLKAEPGESKNYIRAINSLTGYALIDEGTGGLSELKAELSHELSYKELGVSLFNLQSLSFDLTQRLEGENWLPEKAELSVSGDRPILPDLNSRYRARFNCSAAEVATK